MNELQREIEADNICKAIKFINSGKMFKLRKLPNSIAQCSKAGSTWEDGNPLRQKLLRALKQSQLHSTKQSTASTLPGAGKDQC